MIPRQICLHRSKGHNLSDFHFLVKFNGDVIQYHDITEEAMNDKNHNKDVIAIGVEGDFNQVDLTDNQKSSIQNLLYVLCKENKIDTTMHHIFGHCDYRDPPGDRYCPGKNLHRFIPVAAKFVHIKLTELKYGKKS